MIQKVRRCRPADTRESRMPRHVAAPLANGKVSRKSRSPSWMSWKKWNILDFPEKFRFKIFKAKMTHSVEVVHIGGKGKIEEKRNLTPFNKRSA